MHPNMTRQRKLEIIGAASISVIGSLLMVWPLGTIPIIKAPIWASFFFTIEMTRFGCEDNLGPVLGTLAWLIPYFLLFCGILMP